MTRHVLSVVGVALLAAVVGAQGPANLDAAQKARLFKKNREVIEKVVGQTVESSKSPNDPLNRAKSYYDLLLLFSKQITAAGTANDADRVKELTVHLNTLLDKGLTPTLTKAKLQIEGGTGVEEFRKVKIDLLAQLDALLGTLSDNPTAKTSLDGAKARLNGIVIPEPK